MSAEAKAKQVQQKLEQARQAQEKEEAERLERAKQMEAEFIAPPKRVVHCARCHASRKKHLVLDGKTGKYKHDCVKRGVPACADFKCCGYEAGHKKQVSAAKRVAKLEAKAAQVSAAAEQEVP